MARTYSRCCLGCLNVRIGARIIAILNMINCLFFAGILLILVSESFSITRHYYGPYPEKEEIIDCVDRVEVYDYSLFFTSSLLFLNFLLNFNLSVSTYKHNVEYIRQWYVIHLTFYLFFLAAVGFIFLKNKRLCLIIFSIPGNKIFVRKKRNMEAIEEPQITINLSARRIALLNNIVLYIYVIFRVLSGNFGGTPLFCLTILGYNKRCVIFEQDKDSLKLKLRGLMTIFNCIVLIIVNHSLRFSTRPSPKFLKKAMQFYIAILIIYLVNAIDEYRAFSLDVPYKHEYGLVLIAITIYHILYYGIMLAEVCFIFYPTYKRELEAMKTYDKKIVNPT